jgi:uncharacterized protein (UPF0276 family)
MSGNDPGGLAAHGIGLGLRIPHYPRIFADWPEVDFFEIISENFMGGAELPARNLDRILARYPVVLHGTGLGIASAEPLDPGYLRDLKALADRANAPYVTDHLCWTAAEGIHHHELLPFPYTERNARYVAERAARVQDFLGRPFGLENLSSYVAFRGSEMPEWEFYRRVVELSGCHYMLDLNNIHVSCVNHGYAAAEYLASIRWDRVLQCHIAGHTVNADGTILDTHDTPVSEEVWELYRLAWARSGGFRTLLERDGNIPPFEELRAESRRALAYREAAWA